MFDVITIANTAKKQKFFKKRKCKIEALQTAVRGGAPFRLISITPGTKGIDWAQVARSAGCASQCVLLSNKTQLPENTPLKLFAADTLPLLIMLNTASNMLSTDEAAKTRRLLIVDKAAVLPDYIDRIILNAAKIKIITDYPEKYYTASQRVMERFGAAITVCSQTEENEEFDAAISLEAAENAALSFDFDRAAKEDLVSLIPDEYLRLCPEDIDKFDFACALFECSGVRAIGELWLDF